MATGYEGYGGYGMGYGATDPASMRARLAMAMLQRGSDSSPIRSPWQGAARLSDSLFGALMMRQMQDQLTSGNQDIIDQYNRGRAGGFGTNGSQAGGAGLPSQPGALSDLMNDPDITAAAANANRLNLPNSSTVGDALRLGGNPNMGPPMPAMAPNNSAGGLGPGGAPGAPPLGGPPLAALAPSGNAFLHNSVAGPGVPSQPFSSPASGNGPQGAGAASLSPDELAMFQGDMRAVPGTPAQGGSTPQGGGGGGGFMDRLAQIESGNQNIYSRTDPDVAGPGTRSQGYFQINTPTWQQFAPRAGVDVSNYPNAMRAPREVQEQVASVIPFGRFGPRTRNMLGQQYGSLDTRATIGQLAGNAGGGGGNAFLHNSVAGPGVPSGVGGTSPQSAPNDAAMFAQDMQGVPGSPGSAPGIPGSPPSPQGPPGSMQPNMMVAGPGAPSMGRGGGNPNAPPLPPTPSAPGGGGNPFAAIGNLFGMGNPSSPQGGGSPASAGGGGSNPSGMDPDVLMRVALNPYASPEARQMASSLLQYSMPHPIEWKEIKGTNDQQGYDFLGRPVPGMIQHGGPMLEKLAPGEQVYPLTSSGQAVGGQGGGGAAGGGGSMQPIAGNSGLDYARLKAQAEQAGKNQGGLMQPSGEDLAKFVTNVRGDENYKETDVATGAYNTMQDVARINGANADKDLIINLARIYNPGRAVAQGMYGVMHDIQSLPDTVTGEIQKVIDGGGTLSTQTRMSMLTLAKQRIDQYGENWKTAQGTWAKEAQAANIPPQLLPDVVKPRALNFSDINRFQFGPDGLHDSFNGGRLVDPNTFQPIQPGVVGATPGGQPAPVAASVPPIAGPPMGGKQMQGSGSTGGTPGHIRVDDHTGQQSQGQPPSQYPNAVRGSRGNWLVPDPNNKGKYLQVSP